MTVVAATFGALSEVQLMHDIYHFKAQEVKNPMLQMVCNLELKRRSYSHCKSITLSWRKHFAKVLRNHPFVAKWFRSLFLQCCGFPPEVARYMPHVGSWEPQDESQLRSPTRITFCCEVISQPFLYVCEISQTPFSLAKWFLEHPDICYRHWEIFCIRFLLTNSPFSACNPPIIGFLTY